MRPISRKELREIQLTELEMLEEVHRICEKHRIPYVIIAGTLLGAIRHKGFIPWDDDADVAMLRRDYEKFRAVCKTELDRKRFVFQDDRNTKGYRWGYGKLRRKGTLFLREHQEDMPYFQGIFIDVFPLDEVPQDPSLRAFWDLKCFVIRKMLWARVGKKADPVPWKRAVYALMDRLPEEKILAGYHALIQDSARIEAAAEKSAAKNRAKTAAGTGETRRVRILMFPTPNGDHAYCRKWYCHRKKAVFEGRTFYGIRDAEEYLRFKFGDFRKLPPEKERKTHPVSALKLLSERRPESEKRRNPAEAENETGTDET